MSAEILTKISRKTWNGQGTFGGEHPLMEKERPERHKKDQQDSELDHFRNATRRSEAPPRTKQVKSHSPDRLLGDNLRKEGNLSYLLPRAASTWQKSLCKEALPDKNPESRIKLRANKFSRTPRYY